MLTDAKKRVYTAVVQLIAKRPRTPRYREIAKKAGVRSLATVHKHIKVLIWKGWLRRPMPRELEVVPVALRNGREWHSCGLGHAMCWFQVERCPACLKVTLDEDF